MSAPLSAVDNVCLATVAKGLCVGCGVCAGVCPADNLDMRWTADGMLQPVDEGHCLPNCQVCLNACPFQEHDHNEDTLAAARFADVPGIHHDPSAGYYLTSYVGYARGELRERGASGGLATWLLTSLLEHGEVDRVVCARPTGDPDRLFALQVCSSVEQVRSASGSVYYPVDLSAPLRNIRAQPCRFAIVGLPCFLKAVRLAMLNESRLQERVRVMVGLVCGQLKTRDFTEYLSRAAGLEPANIRNVRFRGKDVTKPASELIFAADGAMLTSSVLWSGLYGKAWHSGEFSLKACDYCDDMFAEVADVAVMDAWLPPYVDDGRGTSICLVRSRQIHDLLQKGITTGELTVDQIPLNRVLSSQNALIKHKRSNLAYRLALADAGSFPRKRVAPVIPPRRVRRQILARDHVRVSSHSALQIQRARAPQGLGQYKELMKPLLEEYAASRRPPILLRYAKGVLRRLKSWTYVRRGKP